MNFWDRLDNFNGLAEKQKQHFHKCKKLIADCKLCSHICKIVEGQK